MAYTNYTHSKKNFDTLSASHLYCSRCKKATPSRERLLLILPEGNLYDIYCEYCGTSNGNRQETEKKDTKLIVR